MFLVSFLSHRRTYFEMSFRTASKKSPEQNSALRALFMKQELPKLTRPTFPKGCTRAAFRFNPAEVSKFIYMRRIPCQLSPTRIGSVGRSGLDFRLTLDVKSFLPRTFLDGAQSFRSRDYRLYEKSTNQSCKDPCP